MHFSLSEEGYQTEKATIEMLSHAPGDMQWLTIYIVFKNNDIVKEINLDVFRCKMSTYEEK